MNQNDKRYIKNERIMKKTFLELLRTKKYNEITINELCQEALISKHTFYSHYDNKEAFVKSIMCQLIEGLIALYSERQLSEEKVLEMQDMTYEYIEANYDAFYVFFLHDDTMNFSRLFVYYIRKYILGDSDVNIHTCAQEVLIIDYMLYGGVSIIRNWVLHHEDITLEEIKILACQILKETHMKVSDIKLNMIDKR